MKKINSLPADYGHLLQSVKKQIQKSRIRAYRTVNKELIQLYWNIGKEISERQESEGWGKSVVKRLSHDLRTEFPGTSGFSSFAVSHASSRRSDMYRAAWTKNAPEPHAMSQILRSSSSAADLSFHSDFGFPSAGPT